MTYDEALGELAEDLNAAAPRVANTRYPALYLRRCRAVFFIAGRP